MPAGFAKQTMSNPAHKIDPLARPDVTRPLDAEQRRHVAAMLDAATTRTGRLLVVLVEHDGLPVERAADALNVTPSRAREWLASFALIVRAQERTTRHAAETAAAVGTLLDVARGAAGEPKRLAPWRPRIAGQSTAAPLDAEDAEEEELA